MKLNIKIKQIFLVLIDVASFYASLFLVIYLNFYFEKRHALALHFDIFSLILFLWLIIFYIMNLYEIRDLDDKKKLFQKHISAVLIGMMFAIMFFYFIPYLKIAPKKNLFLFASMFLIINIFIRNIYFSLIKNKIQKEKVFIVGNGEVEDKIRAFIEKNKQIGFEVKAHTKDENDPFIANVLEERAKDKKIGLVIIPYKSNENSLASKIINKEIGRGLRVKNAIEASEVFFRKIPISEINNSWVSENILNRSKIYERFIRPFEIIASAILSILFLPIFVIIGIFIKFSSTGPIFFKQIRTGKNKKEFILWKFRTMGVDAEKDGPKWATKNDLRVTGIGKFLRKTHLDELPQLINIFKGDLSFIGPRPERPEFIKILEKEIPYYNTRHTIKPGILGWAQLNYKYGASVEETLEKVQYDLYYLKNRSIILDLVIFMKTIKRFFISAN